MLAKPGLVLKVHPKWKAIKNINIYSKLLGHFFASEKFLHMPIISQKEYWIYCSKSKPIISSKQNNISLSK